MKIPTSQPNVDAELSYTSSENVSRHVKLAPS